MRLLRALAFTLAATAVGTLLYAFFSRLGYPYDLEWMEGGMLCHALRLLEGKPIYGPPSVDFVPFLYTPLYPALVALLAKVVGLSYRLARLISVLSFGAALLIGYVFARREGGSRPAAFAALALPAAAYVPTGAWYDLARPDSLFLALTSAALFIGWWKRHSHGGAALAALLMVAAFFTKQTASPFMLALGVTLLLVDYRVALTYGASLALVGLPALYLFNHASQGWFWTYVFKLHQQHDFYPGRAFLGSPTRLILLVGPALLTLPWALARRRTPGLLYAVWIAAAGAASSCLGFGTQWAFTNAFIPGIFFLAVAIGTAAGRLVDAESAPRLRPGVVYLLLSLSLVAAPGGLLLLAARVTPRDWAIDRTSPTGYRVAAFLPTPEARQHAEAVISRLRTTPGEVLIPFHPFYGYLAGKKTYLHRMGVLDVGRAGLGAPLGLADAIAAHRFSLVVMDYKIDGNWQWWPGLLQNYRIVERLSGAPTFSGADTAPRYLLTPNHLPASDEP